MHSRAVLFVFLWWSQGCDEHAEATPSERDIVAHQPAPTENEDPALSAPLALPGDELAPLIITPSSATLSEVLAAKEVRRYLYLRTGSLLRLVATDVLPEGDAVLVAEQSSPLLADLDGMVEYVNPSGGFLIKSVEQERRTVLVISGSDPDSTLHAAYRFAEHLGVGFGLEGDVIPDARIEWSLSGHDEVAVPVLETRGLLPFHDFPEGPDFWNTDDYLLVLSQMPKLGLNFIGLHTYPRWSSTEEAGL